MGGGEGMRKLEDVKRELVSGCMLTYIFLDELEVGLVVVLPDDNEHDVALVVAAQVEIESKT